MRSWYYPCRILYCVTLLTIKKTLNLKRNKENEHAFQLETVTNYKQTKQSNRFQYDLRVESYWKRRYLKRYQVNT